MLQGRAAIGCAAVLVATATGVVAWRVSAPDEPSRSGARGHALAACSHFDDAIGGVRDNASAERVFDALGKAADEARRAARGDAVYAQLASAILLVRSQVERDETTDLAPALSLAAGACDLARKGPSPSPFR